MQNTVVLENAEGGEEDEMSQMHQQLTSQSRNEDLPPEGPDSFIASPSAALLAASPERTKMDEPRPTWIRPRTEAQGAPSPRSHTSVVFHKNKVWIFGGYGGDRQARMHLGDLICIHAQDERAKLWAQVYFCLLNAIMWLSHFVCTFKWDSCAPCVSAGHRGIIIDKFVCARL